MCYGDPHKKSILSKGYWFERRFDYDITGEKFELPTRFANAIALVLSFLVFGGVVLGYLWVLK